MPGVSLLLVALAVAEMQGARRRRGDGGALMQQYVAAST